MKNINDSKVLKVPILRSVSRDRNLSLSFAEESVWFSDQLMSQNTLYNIPVAIRLTGSLNIVALEQTLNEILRRHEILRTNFSTLERPQVRLISPIRNIPLGKLDLSLFPEAEMESQVVDIATKETKKTFNLTRDLLLRANLLCLNEGQHVLLLTIHRIVADDRSIELLVSELASLYEAFSNGKPSPLPNLTIQYADFAYWQREWMQGEVLEHQLSYWKQQLAGAPPVLELPVDRPRPAVQTFQGARQPVMLSTTLTEALKSFSQQKETTLFVTLLTVFKTMLCCYTGEEDIIVGSPVDNRNWAGIEKLIGSFSDNLVLRTDFSGNPTFENLLKRVHKVVREAHAHHDLPFVKLVEKLQPTRGLSYTPLFQVMFILQDTLIPTFELPNLILNPMTIDSRTAKFDLTFTMMDSSSGLSGFLDYNTDLFDSATITRMLDHFTFLLENIVTNPDQDLLNLPLLPKKQQLSTRSGPIRIDKPFIRFEKRDIEQSIPTRFEQQVEKYPQKLAIKTRTIEWTYNELNGRANQISQKILTLLGRGQGRIALLFEHDAPMIAGMLGILKADKTYVPLDTSFPRERLVYMLEDSQAEAIVTNHINLDFAKGLAKDSLQIINIDDINFSELANDIKLPISPDSIAYILYTSGSTGKPKGVTQNHRNVLHHMRIWINNLHIGTDDRLTLLSSYSWDSAVQDTFGALLNGASVYPLNIKEEGLANLSEWLAGQKITIYHSTLPVYRHLMRSLMGTEAFPTLRLVILGGDAIYKSDVDLYRKHFSNNCILVNAYGSTETTTCLQYLVNKQMPIKRNVLPVGYPVEDTEVLLLDDAGEQVTGYGIGEIVVKSSYVSPGYWRNREMTAARFRADPEDGDNQIYYIGDLGRFLADGSIALVGRKDSQVKIRGFRVEPGEVEAVLNQHSAVQENVVAVKEDATGDKYLVGYVVPSRDGLTISELRHFLKEKMPNYMVPAIFMILEALPLTPNRKIDRQALPQPDNLRPELETAYVAPSSKIEQIIGTIWQEVLPLEKIGIYDNFFDVGGHSLHITQVHSKLEDALNKEIPMITLFKYPTINTLAKNLSEQQDELPSFEQNYDRAQIRRESTKRQKRARQKAR